MNIGIRCFQTALVGLLFAVSAPMANADIIKDMVHFDQAYIPVLATTSDEKLIAARKAMKALKLQWQSFSQKHELYGDDPNWETDMDKIGSRIAAAEKIVTDGKKIKDAHEELEHIRIIFMNMRERNGIDYFIDNLTLFHEPMEEIVLTVKGKTPDSLSASDIERIKHHLPKTMLLWEVTGKAKFDPAVYEFNPQQASSLHELIKKEQQALANLQKALAAGDKKQVIATGMAIKPNFAQVFKLFGRFPSPS